MVLYVLDSEFNVIGAIEKIHTLSYSEKLYECGELYLEIPFDATLYSILKPFNRILVGDAIYTLQRTVYRDGRIRVYGEGLFTEYKDNFFVTPAQFEGTPCNLLYSLISLKKFSGVSFTVYSSSDTENSAIQYNSCTSYYDVIKQLCHDNELGFRFSFEPDTKMLKCYTLTRSDKSSAAEGEKLVISDRRDSFFELEENFDISNYKNSVHVLTGGHIQSEIHSCYLNKIAPLEPEKAIAVYHDILVTTEDEFDTALQSYASEVLSEHAKKHRIRVKMLNSGDSYTLGTKCYFESVMLGRYFDVLISEKKVEINDTLRSLELILEVE